VLHILNGEDLFRRNEALQALRADLEAAAGGLGQTSRYDVNEKPLDEVLTACRTAGFFAESRLVIIDNLLDRYGGNRARGRGRKTARRGDTAEPASEMDGVVEALTNLPPATTVVLIDDVPDTNALLKALTPAARAETFAFLKRDRYGDHFRDWFDGRIRERGVRFTPAARDRILRLIDSTHIGELAQEIDKLALYCGDRPVEVTDVDAMVSAAQAYKIWDLTDAVVDGRREAALRVAQELLNDKQAATLQIYMLTRHYRQLILLQAYLAEGVGQQEALSRVGVTHSYVADKLLRQVHRYGPGDLEAAYARLLETDASIKRGLLDEETALTLLITDLAALGGRRPALSLRR
jgi:DNA polymerase-3 subunit delta